MNTKESDSNPNEKHSSGGLHGLANRLSNISEWMRYLNSPVLAEGILKYNNNRYWIDDKALRHGDMVEIFKNGVWQRCLIYEGSGRQRIHDFSESELMGRAARLRGRIDL